MPARGTSRWTPWRKAAVIIGVREGTLTVAEACDHYKLSPEELAGWDAAFDRRGISGLFLKNREPALPR